jgi:hypothetical protein
MSPNPNFALAVAVLFLVFGIFTALGIFFTMSRGVH